MEGIRRTNSKKFCIDTDVAIETIKGNPAVLELFKNHEKIPAISVITIFELLRRRYDFGPVETFILQCEVLVFDEITARKASLLEKELVRKGKPILFRDLFIAATAIVNNCELATLNRKDFENIEGLSLVEF